MTLETHGQGELAKATTQLDNLEQLLPPKTELEPHEAELGFEIVEAVEGEFGPTIILGHEIPMDDPALESFRPWEHPDVGFVGGAARAGLALALGIPPRKPRDIDIIKFSPDAQLPKGWGLTYDTWTNVADYMQRRDLTVNEVLLHFQPDEQTGGRLMVYATREAICDTLDNVICPSVGERASDGKIRSRLAARAIRFAARERQAGNDVALELPPIIGDEIWTFDLALQLERAVDDHCVEEYIDLVRPYTDLPNGVTEPGNVLRWLQDRLDDEYEEDDPRKFEFSLRTINQLNPVDDPFDDDAYDQMYALGAKQFRRYNQLARNPKLSTEDLVA
jgi:hypothetical protein